MVFDCTIFLFRSCGVSGICARTRQPRNAASSVRLSPARCRFPNPPAPVPAVPLWSPSLRATRRSFGVNRHHKCPGSAAAPRRERRDQSVATGREHGRHDRLSPDMGDSASNRLARGWMDLESSTWRACDSCCPEIHEVASVEQTVKQHGGIRHRPGPPETHADADRCQDQRGLCRPFNDVHGSCHPKNSKSSVLWNGNRWAPSEFSIPKYRRSAL